MSDDEHDEVVPVPQVRADLKPFVAVVVLALLAVVALNASVDAGGLGNQGEMAALARDQKPNEILVSDQLGYQRAWVKTRLLEAKKCPDILVLGSSTSGALSQEMFPDRSFLNGWTGGPTIEDFEAITNVLRRAPCVPKTIVIGADPWWVGNGEVDDQRWQALEDEFLSYQREDSAPRYAFFVAKMRWNRSKERLNFTTTKESARLLMERRRHGAAEEASAAKLVAGTPEEICPRVEQMGGKHLRSYDGHYTTCPVFRWPPVELDRLATHWLSDNMHKMAEWNSVDTTRVTRLARVVDQLRGRGARVVFVGNPYHPETWKRLLADPTVGIQLLRLDQMLDAIAKERGSVFVNLRDPARAGCTVDEFEDADHGTPECVKKVASILAKEAGL